jgi:hypothetical protein
VSFCRFEKEEEEELGKGLKSYSDSFVGGARYECVSTNEEKTSDGKAVTRKYG